MPWEKSLLLALLAATLTSTATAAHVAVRFGSLHWIDAQGGLPRVQAGRVLVPLKPACNLLGLTCQVQGRSARVGSRLIPLKDGFVPLRALVAENGGYTLTYDDVAHVAVVGTLPNVDMLATPWMQANNDWGVHLRSPYLGPLSVRKTRKAGRIRYTLSTHGSGLNEMTLLSGFPPGWGANVQSLDVTGAQRPSLPDNPNRDPGCSGKPECTGTVGREALWVLAALDAK